MKTIILATSLLIAGTPVLAVETDGRYVNPFNPRAEQAQPAWIWTDRHGWRTTGAYGDIPSECRPVTGGARDVYLNEEYPVPFRSVFPPADLQPRSIPLKYSEESPDFILASAETVTPVTAAGAAAAAPAKPAKQTFAERHPKMHKVGRKVRGTCQVFQPVVAFGGSCAQIVMM